MTRTNYTNNEITTKRHTVRRRSWRRIKIGGAAICASAFLLSNAYLFTSGSAAFHDATVKVQEAEGIASENAQAVEDANDEIQRLQQENEILKTKNQELTEKNQKLKEDAASSREVSRGYSESQGMNVEVTAYTLSEASCNKGRNHPAYGKTATGTNLAGHTLYSARAIAVDPRVIPLGSRVKISFKDPEMKKYNGIYTAVDTGGATKGSRIDLFAGEGAESLAMHIGRRTAKAEIV